MYRRATTVIIKSNHVGGSIKKGKQQRKFGIGVAKIKTPECYK